MDRRDEVNNLIHMLQVAGSCHLSSEQRKEIDRWLWKFEDRRFEKIISQRNYWIDRAKKAEMSNRHGGRVNKEAEVKLMVIHN